MRTLCLALTLLLSPLASVAAESCVPPAGDEQAGRISGADTCLVALLFEGNRASGGAGPLFVLVHGDNGGKLGQGQVDIWRRLARKLVTERPDARAVFMQRPGYLSPLGKSDGWANERDDDYTASNVERLAVAVIELRSHYRPSRMIYFGHSGGAVMGALAFGRYGAVADAFVLVGCACGDLGEWRQHRNAQRGAYGANLWPNSLSPLSNLEKVVSGVPVVLVTGDRDDNTLPKFSHAWLERAKAMGVDVTFVSALGQSHGGSTSSPEALQAALQLARN